MNKMAKHLVSEEARRVQLAERDEQLKKLRRYQKMTPMQKALRIVGLTMLIAGGLLLLIDLVGLVNIHSTCANEADWQEYQTRAFWWLGGVSFTSAVICLLIGLIFSLVLNLPRKVNRSAAGNGVLFFIMGICGVFMALPLVMIFNNALKPLDELYQYPPQVFVRNPTLENFSDLFVLMNGSWVPFSRYILNTVIITVGGMVGHVIVASMAAYPLAKHKFPGKTLLFGMVVLSLMFSWTVTQIPQYMIISWLGINNTYFALILPAWSFGMGLYLMKQFMEQLPDSLMESARIEGASEWCIFWKIVMPNVKPAWLTLMIFSFQNVWNSTGNTYIYKEQLKLLPTVMSQMAAGGVARVGVGAAASVVLMIPTVLLFVFTQTNIIDTMTTSGMKD